MEVVEEAVWAAVLGMPLWNIEDLMTGYVLSFPQ